MKITDTTMRTVTGRYIDLEKFSQDDIDIRDIAISLSRQRRYAGHTLVPYTVGQHLLFCGFVATSLGFSDDEVKACILHDVEETWTQDIIAPIKRSYMLGKYKSLSEKVSKTAYEFFGIERHSKKVKDIDLISYELERKRLMIDETFVDWGTGVDPILIGELIEKGCYLDDTILNMTEDEVYKIFVELLSVYHAEKQLGGEIVIEDDLEKTEV